MLRVVCVRLRKSYAGGGGRESTRLSKDRWRSGTVTTNRVTKTLVGSLTDTTFYGQKFRTIDMTSISSFKGIKLYSIDSS